MDNQTKISQLKEQVKSFVAERNWQEFHSPKNLALSISIESAELMEHFQWLSLEESKEYLKDAKNHDEVAMELADVIIYCISFANTCDIDISEAIFKKMAVNETRFKKD